MGDYFLERISLFTFVEAPKHQIVFDLTHYMVLSKKETNGMASCAFKMILVRIAFGLSFGKCHVAISAT